MQVYTFSKGKGEINEDTFNFNDTNFIVCDGVTFEKTSHPLITPANGHDAAQLVATEALTSELNGLELSSFLTERLNEHFKSSVGTSMCLARFEKDFVHITQIGDVGFRLNGQEIYLGTKIVDLLTSGARQHYIQQTGDIKGGRDFILPILQAQNNYKNNPEHPLGYGILNGTTIPEKFVNYYKFEIQEIKTLEIFTDGYFNPPKEVSIKAWEDSYEHVENVDPDKYLQFPSTKSSDDRTILIIEV